MTWYEAGLLTIAVFAGVGVVLIGPVLLAGLFDKLLEGYRRKKHPEYFKYWDKALSLSFKRDTEFKQRKERFDFFMKLYNECLRDGECSEEYYLERMNKHMKEYQELCAWFREEEKELRELLIKADLYAKEHNLKWGIVYDSKRK
jgi:hypothetical protein